MPRVHIFGGGTVFHIRPHTAIAAPAYGHTARYLVKLIDAMHPHPVDGATVGAALTALPIASALKLPRHLEPLVGFVREELWREDQCGPCKKAMQDGRVVNRAERRKYDVLVMRPGPFGNPFRIGVHGDRAAVLAKHREYLQKNDALVARIRRELRGKRLGCCCYPEPCHADTLAFVADGGELWSI